MEARSIRLRRPVTLSVMDGLFVPAGGPGLLDEVERRWRAVREKNPDVFDGRLLHVIGVHRNGHGGAVLHVVDCAYRFHAVQDEDFDLGVRPLGVKGVTIRDGAALLGRRSQRVGSYRGLWEFAPGGMVEPGMNPATAVQRELEEETTLRAAAEPIALAVLYDPVIRTWELVLRLDPARDGEAEARPEEYDELRWCTGTSLPRDLTPIALQMIPLVTSLLDAPARSADRA